MYKSRDKSRSDGRAEKPRSLRSPIVRYDYAALIAAYSCVHNLREIRRALVNTSTIAFAETVLEDNVPRREATRVIIWNLLATALNLNCFVNNHLRSGNIKDKLIRANWSCVPQTGTFYKNFFFSLHYLHVNFVNVLIS